MKFENHLCSDIEPYAQELYKLRFPDSIQLGDITQIDTQELKNKYPGEWILSGGFPCQDISIAGKGAGIHGERSGLWFEYWRLINDLRPRFAVMENVGMLVHRGLREVLGSLAEIGYNAEWQDIRAEDVGAPHKRERIWIVAYAESTGAGENNGRIRQGISGIDRGEKADRKIPDTIIKHDDNTGYGAGEICGKRSEATEIQGSIPDTMHSGLQTERPEQQTTGATGSDTKISDTSIAGLEREKSTGRTREHYGLSTECGNELSDTGRKRKTERRDQGFSEATGVERQGANNGRGAEIDVCGEWWSTESDVGRLANGIPRRVDRLKGLGNAIVPQIAEILFRQIKELL